MDWLDFIASIVRSAAWPLSLIAIAWILRTQLRAMLDRVVRIRSSGVDVEFAKKVDELAAQSAAEAASLDHPGPPEAPTGLTAKAVPDRVSAVDLARELADHPMSAIVAAADILEQELARYGTSLQSNEHTTITGLRRLRDMVKHDEALATPSAALRYAELVDDVLSRLAAAASE